MNKDLRLDRGKHTWCLPERVDQEMESTLVHILVAVDNDVLDIGKVWTKKTELGLVR